MDALVRKGILTEQEAEDIKADVAKENRQYNKVTVEGKTVSGLKLYGDFRGRYEYFSSENDAFVDRNRFRYRLRTSSCRYSARSRYWMLSARCACSIPSLPARSAMVRASLRTR